MIFKIKDIIMFTALWVVLFYGVDYFVPYDDTDNEREGERSGFHLYTDHGTGCQYISKFFGSPIPRLDADGNHICKGN